VAGSDASEAELYALPFVPAEIARERERFGAYATRTMGGNLLGDLLQDEVRKRERVVAIDGEAVLLSAFAARVPYQLMLVPRTPRARFEDDGPTGAALLADALRRIGQRPVDVWVRTAPSGAEHFCWRIEIAPRVAARSSLEPGTGIPINPVSPERAAAELREA
jgi:UDPglucose--hexose-1-phosphate uridylyltransferase